jgi:hypothetical protein
MRESRSEVDEGWGKGKTDYMGQEETFGGKTNVDYFDGRDSFTSVYQNSKLYLLYFSGVYDNYTSRSL